jgi:hypothetical protein
MPTFELREQHKSSGNQPFDGGSLALTDETSLDLADALEKGNGKITTDDPAVADLLGQSEVFKQAAESSSSSAKSSKGGDR